MNTESPAPVKLTQHAKATGCSCKIAPAMLQDILAKSGAQPHFPALLVGHDHADDAAVYQLGDDQVLIATTDFFTPIVDDAYEFGRIAAANALSDVYAMGAKPVLALAMLGWPVDNLSPELAAAVIEGARSVCTAEQVPLAGGHSIIAAEPLFGLSVNGLGRTSQVKQNSGAKAGDLLLLTKPLGTGILATANKRGLLNEAQYATLLALLTKVNSIGAKLGEIDGVHAMTDITGFGLAGHLTELATASELSAHIRWSNVPVLEDAKAFAKERVSPDATFRNWNAVSAAIGFGTGVDVMESFSLLPDPQTNGGLLLAVAPEALAEVQQCLAAAGYDAHLAPIGELVPTGEKRIQVMA